MCGICGIAVPHGVGRRVDDQVVVRMRDVMEHRGPDAAGLFIDDGVGLGHRRLSIVDIASGAQPMASDDGRLQLIYNGEIYNHPELKSQLEGQGVRYKTRCDTETLLRLYEREGPDAVHRLRGMFAFAVWHLDTRQLVLVRDRFGIKPLYYALLDDGTLVFGSEIKAVLEGGVRPELNRVALPDFLANHATAGDATLFNGVRRLPPGHVLTWRNGHVSLRRYWDLSMGGAPLTGRDDDLVDEYRGRLRESVRLRLMADVPLGVFLSGGIDSASIAALMASLVDDQIKTFSVAFAEREANELAYARAVATRFRTAHHEIVLSPEAFWQSVPKLIWHEDEPMAHPSSVALYHVAHLAEQHVKVVLTGEGSDETLAGYNRYRVTIFNMLFGRAYHRVVPGMLRSAVRAGLDRLPRTSKWRRRLSRTFLGLPPDLDTIYFDNFAVFGRAWQAQLLSEEALDAMAVDPYRAYHEALDRCGSDDLLDRLLYADTFTYLHELLMKQDQMSMAASIESRVPFLDHQLAEFATRLPRHLKLKGATTKVVLRKAMRDVLPEQILRRPKMGFPVPIGRWLRGPFRTMVDDFVLSERALERGLFEPSVVRRLVSEHIGGVGGHQERLWTLINFEMWCRAFLDGEPVEHMLSDAPQSALVRAS